MTTKKICTHLDAIKITETAPGKGCDECIAVGDAWLHLRLCLSCGNVGCCESSKNKHAAGHFKKTGHPIMSAYGQEGIDARWCYIDEMEV
jgi:uncharacterized UBP type Zn finger protein